MSRAAPGGRALADGQAVVRAAGWSGRWRWIRREILLVITNIGTAVVLWPIVPTTERDLRARVRRQPHRLPV